MILAWLQGEPVNPRKPAKTGNGAIKFPWQSNGSKGSPLPPQPKRTSPAQAISIATGEALRVGPCHALNASRFGLAGTCSAHEMCRSLEYLACICLDS